ncbi:hypothetical protein ACFFX0_10600 [Citricoccus parietis]|uniref:Uncharacterized protein n=1 Tax=Citricoccus parietis TaxID=592307 RepID=A0ABV5FY68_9MICC
MPGPGRSSSGARQRWPPRSDQSPWWIPLPVEQPFAAATPHITAPQAKGVTTSR